MNFKKCCLVAILVITSNFVIYAQNARFSQIGTIATQLNPSLTGIQRSQTLREGGSELRMVRRH